MPTKPKAAPHPEVLAYSVAQLPRVMGLGASVINGLLKSGQLPSRKVGRRTLILRSDVEAYLNSLPLRVAMPVPTLPAYSALPTVADDPANPAPIDRIIDAAMHAELAEIRKPSLLGPDHAEMAALAIGPVGVVEPANDYDDLEDI